MNESPLARRPVEQPILLGTKNFASRRKLTFERDFAAERAGNAYGYRYWE